MLRPDLKNKLKKGKVYKNKQDRDKSDDSDEQSK